MTKIRWGLLTIAALGLAAVFSATDDVTVRFLAGYVAAFGLLTLGASEAIIATSRSNLETRMANIRGGGGEIER